MKQGKIIKNISNIYTVISENVEYECQARGKFRDEKLTPLVGDEVLFNATDKYILKILPRVNELKRPHISNVDYALIVTSLKEPMLSLNLLDKEIASIILANIKPLICFTKLDLLTKEELKDLKVFQKYYKELGIKVFTNLELKELTKFLKHKYVVLTGQTGAGKSSLINRLDKSLSLEVGDISKALKRGKHTTRHTQYYNLKNVYIADTPGFSSLDLSLYTTEEIKNAFFEFQNYTCKYRDCNHLKEDNCAVKDAVLKGKILKSRYENYCSFIKEVK